VSPGLCLGGGEQGIRWYLDGVNREGCGVAIGTPWMEPSPELPGGGVFSGFFHVRGEGQKTGKPIKGQQCNMGKKAHPT